MFVCNATKEEKSHNRHFLTPPPPRSLDSRLLPPSCPPVAGENPVRKGHLLHSIPPLPRGRAPLPSTGGGVLGPAFSGVNVWDIRDGEERGGLWFCLGGARTLLRGTGGEGWRVGFAETWCFGAFAVWFGCTSSRKKSIVSMRRCRFGVCPAGGNNAAGWSNIFTPS